jgi:hypothetical protein
LDERGEAWIGDVTWHFHGKTPRQINSVIVRPQ